MGRVELAESGTRLIPLPTETEWCCSRPATRGRPPVATSSQTWAGSHRRRRTAGRRGGRWRPPPCVPSVPAVHPSPSGDLQDQSVNIFTMMHIFHSINKSRCTIFLQEILAWYMYRYMLLSVPRHRILFPSFAASNSIQLSVPSKLCIHVREFSYPAR